MSLLLSYTTRVRPPSITPELRQLDFNLNPFPGELPESPVVLKLLHDFREVRRLAESQKEADRRLKEAGKKATHKPTSFMMTTKFKGVLLAELDGEWCLLAPLSSEQQQYIRALGLTEESLLRKGKTRDHKLPGGGREGWGM